jgi:DNA-directed RNA polymerase subunit omega
MRNDYLQNALKVIDDPNILVNVVSRRVKQLKRGNRALVESLEKLSAEDTALREIAEGKITYELATPEIIAASRPDAGPHGYAVGNQRTAIKYQATTQPAANS